MFLPPDRQRHSHLVPARALARRLGAAARAVAWHSLNPRRRERFIALDPLRPPSLEYYETQDGWRCPLLYMPAAAQFSGEPVVLSGDLGMGPDYFRFGPSGGLVEFLRNAGFSVYILTHRGSQQSIAPGVTKRRSVDHIWYQDIPSALKRVIEHSGYSRVHWIGHGFGAQLGLGYAAIHGAHQVASITSMCGHLVLPKHRSHFGGVMQALSAMGGPDTVPRARLERWASLWIEGVDADDTSECKTAPVWSRTVMNRATEDVPLSLIRQLYQWSEQGEVSADNGLVSIRALLPTITCPVLHIDNQPFVDEQLLQDYSSIVIGEMEQKLDFFMSNSAQDRVFVPMVHWLDGRRRQAWRSVS